MSEIVTPAFSITPEIHAKKSGRKGTTVTSTGSQIQTVYTRREIKGYCLFKSEIEQLSSFNTHTTAFYSAGFWFIGFFFSLLISIFMQTGELSSSAKAFAWVGGLVSVLGAVVCFILANKQSKMRHNLMERIENDSRPVE